MSSLFLLSEERGQENFETEVRYIYKSKFNLKTSYFFDQKGYKYLYLSYTHGVLSPYIIIEPYDYKKSLSKEGQKVWSLVSHSLLSDHLEGVSKIYLFYSGYRYKILEDILQGEGISIVSPIREYNSRMSLMWIDHIISEDIFRGF